MAAREFRTAVVSVWLICSALLLPALIAPHFVPEGTLVAASGVLQSSHHGQERCPLCGMTRAFIAISHGNLAAAVRLNQGSVALYGILLANEVGVAVFLARRVRGLVLSHGAAACAEYCPSNKGR